VRSAGLLLRRSLAQVALLLALCGAVAATVGVAVACSATVRLSDTAGVQATLQAAAPAERAYRFSFDSAQDVSGQTERARALFSQALHGIPSLLFHEVVSRPVDVTLPSAGSRGSGPLVDGGMLAEVVTSEQLVEGASLVAGEWPGGPAGGETPAAVSAAETQRHGIEIGDLLHLDESDITLRVVGTWAALPSPAWVGPSGVFAEASAEGQPPTISLLVSPESLPGITHSSVARWTVVADSTSIDAAALDRLITASAELQATLGTTGIAESAVKVEGRLVDASAQFRAARAAAHAVVPVGVGVVLLIGLITITQLARLLVATRLFETVLLRSRGAAAWLTVANATEALAVAVLGAIAGFATASAVSGEHAVISSDVLVAGVVCVATVVVLVTSARGSRATGDYAIHRSGRSRSRAVITLAIIVVAAAALALTQFLSYGSPRVQQASGTFGIDPFVALAPALGMVAVAVSLLVVVELVFRAVALAAPRNARLQPGLSARQLSRRFPQYAGAILVVTLAVSALGVAASFSATVSTLAADSAELRAGASVRVLQSDATLRSSPAAAPMGSTIPVLVEEVAITPGEGAGAIVALPATGIRSLGSVRQLTAHPDALSDALSVEHPAAPTVPASATTLSYRLTVEGRAPRTHAAVDGTGRAWATVWVEDATGALSSQRSPIVTVHSEVPHDDTEELALVGVGPWRVVAVDVSAEAELNWTFTVTVGEFASDDAAVTGEPVTWAPQLQFGSFGTAAAASSPSGPTVTLGLHDSRSGGARVMPSASEAPGTYFPGTADALPIAISASVSDTVGPVTELVLAGEALQAEATVVAVLPAVPGAAARPAVLADLSALNRYLLSTSEEVASPDQLWIDTSDPDTIAAGLRAQGAVVTATTELARSPLAEAAGLSLWLAAGGCLALAVVSLAAVSAATLRERRVDVVALTVVGVDASAQARGRLAELLVVVASGLLSGAVAGALISAIVSPVLARSVVDGVPGAVPMLTLPIAPMLVVLAAAGCGFLAVSALHAAGVRRQARGVGNTVEAV